MARAGKRAKILIYSDGVSFTDEATTTSDNKSYQITNALKRIWCKDCAIVVENGGVPTVEAYTLDRLSGKVTFATATSRTITVTGQYLPATTLGCAYEYTWTCSGDNLDNTCFEKEFIARQQGLKDFTASLSRFYEETNMFYNILDGDLQLALEFYSDASLSPDVRAWVKIATNEDSASVDGLVEESIDFEGVHDSDGRSVSFGPF